MWAIIKTYSLCSAEWSYEAHVLDGEANVSFPLAAVSIWNFDNEYQVDICIELPSDRVQSYDDCVYINGMQLKGVAISSPAYFLSPSIKTRLRFNLTAINFGFFPINSLLPSTTTVCAADILLFQVKNTSEPIATRLSYNELCTLRSYIPSLIDVSQVRTGEAEIHAEDKTCIYNAHSIFLRCAVNPTAATCLGCIDYKKESSAKEL